METPPDHSDCPFVSAPFNAVLLVAMGLAYAHNRHLTRFCSYSSFFIHLLLAVQQESIHSNKIHLPVTAYPETESSEYLVAVLALWIASILCSAFVSRVIFQNLPAVSASTVAYSVAVFLVFFLLRAFGPETTNLLNITEDWSIFFYLFFSQATGSIQGAMQVTLLDITSDWRRVGQKVHMIIYCCLIIVQNIISVWGSNGVGAHNVFDIILQLIVVAFLCFPREPAIVVAVQERNSSLDAVEGDLVLTRYQQPPEKHYVQRTKPCEQAVNTARPNLETDPIEAQDNTVGVCVM